MRPSGRFWWFMATFAQIKEIRLLISDPPDVVDIKESAVVSTTKQIAYLVSGVYRDEDNNILEIQVNDTRLGSWYDSYGTSGAVVRALKQILRRLGSQLPLVRSDSGAESVQYTSLKEKYAYYKALLDDAVDDYEEENTNSTGIWMGSASQEIAGGNL